MRRTPHQTRIGHVPSKRFRIPDEALFWLAMITCTGVIIAGSVCIGMIIGHG